MGEMRPLTRILLTSPPAEEEEGVEATGATEGVEVATAPTTLAFPGPLVKVVEGGRKMDFQIKSKFQSSGGKKAMQAMSPMLSGSGLGESPIIETTMKTRI